MAKYLRPRRGSKANAIAQKIKLQKGELFMEFPNGYIGKEPGRLVIGDGASSYDSCNYATSATNVFQPFITDPSIYIPRFANTATSTGSGSVNSGMTSIEKMGNGSSTSTVTLPTIVSAVKEALVYHANSITKLNNDLDSKLTKTWLYTSFGGSTNSATKVLNIYNKTEINLVAGFASGGGHFSPFHFTTSDIDTWFAHDTWGYIAGFRDTAGSFYLCNVSIQTASSNYNATFSTLITKNNVAQKTNVVLSYK